MRPQDLQARCAFRVRTVVFTALLIAGAAGCAGSEGRNAEVIVEWSLDPEPVRIGPTQVTVVLMDSSGLPLEGAEVVLEGTMTHPGMQPSRARARESAPGHYEAPLELTMAGDWTLLLEASLSDRTIRRRHDLPGVRAR